MNLCAPIQIIGFSVRMLGVAWLCLFLSVVSVSRCGMLRSLLTELSRDEPVAECHETEAASAEEAELAAVSSGDPLCRCMLFKLIPDVVTSAPQPPVGSPLLMVQTDQPFFYLGEAFSGYSRNLLRPPRSLSFS